MDKLIARLEQATAEDQRAVIREVLRFARDKDWIARGTYSQGVIAWSVEAYLNAALTLVPAGWGWIIGDDGSAQLLEPDWRESPSDHGLGDATGKANTPALALCIAALKAHEVAG